MKLDQIDSFDWSKGDGLLPAVVQDATNGRVLMLGYMNREALRKTLGEKRVTFYSRSKQRLWTKGETSSNFLNLVDAAIDCDNDTLLITARPDGPTCHNGTDSCFGDAIGTTATQLAFLSRLESVIEKRVSERPEGSYTARLWADGKTRMAQKVGEEGVEVALAAVTQPDDKLIGEAADLLFHLTLLLKSRELSLAHVVAELEKRHAAKS
ncbi:bifunctional phosphoribosyl-AMP cyclohydrolase/phosphoribosyl-ATP diphosphatase HisIE [Steroidobacter sp.]|uniref:bifunctional phosphoribosyl-AMP cyclohydrolase/phosphoribosyl-ATP diphosphatase HisIE n=1 Tax=Steroidobacter sp. TaxID=1978227 RepID=UPI001A52E9E2|nr:bifunctional phosphoribosyl-AMP cyclohydrolase/phosphoribosyl-ATP diphosphatase HisIE [Steroidobacter sp.]MBL8271310.1 bifunctional phosphoribosyl-AMP cyclohydrolase/phosphoribosyl-ATP diphosphatase HisIE [Steroidobacter sp.]